MLSSNSNKEYIRAKRIAFQLLKFRARSEKEIIDRLKRKKISPINITKTVELLKRTELLDDREFAHSWVKAGIVKQLGIRRISFELKQKGIDPGLVEEALDKIKDKYKESEVALCLAKKKMDKLNNIDGYKARQRVYGLLIRRGFSVDIIREVVQEL